MAYDFIFFLGVEKEAGNAYVSTPAIQVADQKTRIIFAKTQWPPAFDDADLLVLPEVPVQTLGREDVYKATGAHYTRNKAPFYLARSDLGIGVVSAEGVGAGLKMRILQVGAVIKESLFAEQKELEKQIRKYEEKIKPHS